MSGFTVARGFSATPESAEELSSLVEDAFGAPITRGGLGPLAGPNHAIQLIAEYLLWGAVVARLIGGKVLDGFISQFGAEAASKLIARFRSGPNNQVEPLPQRIDVDALLRGLAQVALKNREQQTLTIAFPLATINGRNAGIELSGILNGDPEHDRLMLLRGAVALVEMSKRMPRHPLAYTVGPQNRDCSIAIKLEEDGTFGGSFEYRVHALPASAPPELGEVTSYPGPGHYRLTLRFDASGDCLEETHERISHNPYNL